MVFWKYIQNNCVVFEVLYKCSYFKSWREQFGGGVDVRTEVKEKKEVMYT